MIQETIRNLGENEREDSLKLSSFAFQFEVAPEQLQERLGRIKPEQTWGAFIDGKLAAKLIILPFQTYIQGKVFEMGGIAGVATWPEYRRHGLIRKLLLNSLIQMKERGQSVSYLAPFSFAFYRKFGWEAFTDCKKYELDFKQVEIFAQASGRIERIGQDWELLDRIYSAYAVRYNGMLKRSEDWWKNTLFVIRKGTSAVFYDMSGAATGYIMYEVKDRKLRVHELVALDDNARRGLWNFIANHDSMADKLIWEAPMDDQLPYLLSNPRFKQEIIPLLMARIVDLTAFVESYPFNASVAGKELTLQVSDPCAPWNDGTFRLAFDGTGAGRVTRTSGGEQPDIATDIQTLTVLLFSYQRPAFLKTIGRLQAEDQVVRLLEAAIPQRQTNLRDAF